MTLDELIASPDYTSAAPDDRMRHIDDWALQAKTDFPDESKALDEEVPRLKAKEYVTSALPTLGIDTPTAEKYRDLYMQARRPLGSHEPEEWQKYDEDYMKKSQNLEGMTPDERLKFGQFSEIMDRAGKHFQIGEEAKRGPTSAELDYTNGVKIPITTRTLHDRKQLTVTYPDGTDETFDYAFDEEQPSQERLLKFMVENRGQHLGEWKGDFAAINNLGAHVANAAVDMTAAGAQFGDALVGEADAAMFGGNRKRDAAVTMPLFVEKQTGPDGNDRWVKRPRDQFLTELPEDQYKELQAIALDLVNGKAVPDEKLDRFYMNPVLKRFLDSTNPEQGMEYQPMENLTQFPNRDMKGQAEDFKLPEWASQTEAERREVGRMLASAEIAKSKKTRDTLRPLAVDPANLLLNREDQLATTGDGYGAQALDWLGDKAFNIPVAGQALGSSVPTLAAGLVGGPAAVVPFAGLMGLTEGNQAYEDVLQRSLAGGSDAETARMHALAAGAAYGAVATVLEQAGSVFELGVFKNQIGKILAGKIALGFAPETLEESAQSLAQDLISNANLPDDQKRKALDIANNALEAGAGALSFGILPTGGAIMHQASAETVNSPAGQATAAALEDPNLPDAAKQAVAESADLSLQAKATELATAAKEAAQKPAGGEKTEEAAQPAPADQSAPAGTEPVLDPAVAERETQPVIYSDEQGDYTYQNGAWTTPEGTPVTNPALEAARQAFVQTGVMPDGLQPAAPVTPDVTAAPVTAADTAPATAAQDEASKVEQSIRESEEHRRQIDEEAKAREAAIPVEDQLGHEANRANYKALLSGVSDWAAQNPEMAETLRASGGVNIELVGGAVDPTRNATERGDLDSLLHDDTFDPATGKTNVDRKEALESLQNHLATLENEAGKRVQQPSLQENLEAGGQPGARRVSIAAQVNEALAAKPAQPTAIEPEPVTSEVTAETPQTKTAAPVATESAATETNPPAKEKKARVGKKLTPEQAVMRTPAFRTDPTVASDLISRTQGEYSSALGGPAVETVKDPQTGKKKLQLAPGFKGLAEWNWYLPLLEDPAAKAEVDRILFPGGEETESHFDNAASAFGMTGDEYGQAMLAAANERIRIAREMVKNKGATAEDAHMQGAEQQRVAFEDATKKGPRKRPVTTWDLEPGDQLDIDGTPVNVAEMTPEGDAILKDGTRFGRQTLETGDTIWVEKIKNAPGTETGPKFSIAEQPELDFTKPVDIEQVASRLDESAKVPGITVHQLADEIRRFAGNSVPELAYALGLPANATDMAIQLIAENRNTRAQKRADESTEEASKPQPDANETRELTPDEKLEKRRGAGTEEAPEGTRPEDTDEEAPQPNPFVSPSSLGRTPGRMLSKGVTAEHAKAAVTALQKLLPNVQNAWIGTRKQIEKHLSEDARFQKQWKRAWKIKHPAATSEQADAAFTQMLEKGLNNAEAFTFRNRTYVITDQVGVFESDGTPVRAVRRVLIHEDAHEGLQHLRDIDSNVDDKWKEFRNAIPAEELDTIAQSKYPWLTAWRTNADLHDAIADEWFAAKIAEIETRGEPEAGSLVGKFLNWIRGIVKGFMGDGQDVTNKQLLEFMDAARAARFRNRAESQADGMRFSTTNPDGDLPSRRAMQSIAGQAEDNGEELLKSRYQLMSEEQRKAHDEWVAGLPDDMKELSQFLGDPTGYKHIRQSLPIMVSQARAKLGGINDEAPEVNAENTEKAWAVLNGLLTDENYAARYKQEFRDLWSPKGKVSGRPFHRGDATGAVLQMELMAYAARAQEAKMMSTLFRRANDLVLGDYESATRSGAGRTLQVASMASRQGGIWNALRGAYESLRVAVKSMLGEKGLTAIETATDTTKNPELHTEVAAAIDDKVETTQAGAAVVDAVEGIADEYNPDGYWQRVLDEYEGEERKNLHAFWQSLMKLDRLLQIEASLDAEAASQIKPSKAEDVARYKGDRDKLKAEIAAEKARVMELLGKLTTDDTSSESKAKRRKITGKAKAAVKALSATAQAKQMIERFENRNKRLKRDKPAWKAAFDAQVKTPKAKDEFTKALQDAGVTEQTSNRLYDVAGQLHNERAARPKATGSKGSTDVARELERYYAEIEKAEGKHAAMQAKIATREAKAQAKAQNKSQAEEQREAREAEAEEERKAQKRKADLEAYYAEIEAEEGKEAAVQTKLANEHAKAQAKAQNKAQVAAQRQEEKDAMEALRELNRFQTEAEGIITAYGKTKTTAATSKLRELRRQYREGKIDRAAFVSGAKALGVREGTVNHLANITEQELERQKDAAHAATLEQYNKKITGTYTQPKQEIAAELKQKLKSKEITQAEYDAEVKKAGITEAKQKRSDTKAFLSFIAGRILDTPIEQQSDPTWRRQTIIDAFMERGMDAKTAEDAADKMAGIIDRALKEGQAKAAIKTLKAMKKAKHIDPKKLGEAIRSAGLDPLNPNPVVRALAEQLGYKALTPAQFAELARLDAEINSEGPHLAAKAFNKMDRILGGVRPRTGWKKIVTNSWVYSALSSLGVIFLNWLHPIYITLRRLGVDLAGLPLQIAAGKLKPADAPRLFVQHLINWGQAMAGFRSEAAFALKNDAYSNKVLEMLNSENGMHADLLKALEDLKTGNPKQKVTGAIKLLLTSTDYMRRIMASADQTWGAILQQYILQNEAMRMLTEKGGMNAQAAATVLNAAVTEGQKAMADYLAKGGNATEAILVGKDRQNTALKEAVSDLVSPSAAQEMEITATKDPAMEIGNRTGEHGAPFDIVNGILELLKTASTAIINRFGLSGRMIVGFPSVGANILNRSAYFTPLGTLRALHKMYWAKDPESLYAETMATEGQARARLTESIVATLGFILLGLILKKRPEEEGFHITGDGPSDPAKKMAWDKYHKPGHLEYVGADGQVHFRISYTRGGLDSMALPFTFFGALDDMEQDGHKGDKKNANFAWAYGEQVLKDTANQARFFGMKNFVSSFPTSTKDTSIASTIGYTAAPFIPWSGLTKSMTKILTGEQDKTSWKSAFLAQLPIVPAFTGQPALNALGDPVGAQAMDTFTKYSDRLEYAGAPLFIGLDNNPKHADVYKFLLRKRLGVSLPMRSSLEAANGFLSDTQWSRYVRTRGNLLTDAIRENMTKIQFMDNKDSERAMQDISTKATRAAKKELNLQ